MTVKSDKDLQGLLRIGRICGLVLQEMQSQVEPGMTTAELDDIGKALLKKHGARSAPILAYQFPGHTCISVNDEAAHGIPGKRVIQPGDLVNIDVSAELDGYWADTGGTVPVPPVSDTKQQLCDATQKALDAAIDVARAGVPINQIGRAIEAEARKGNYGVIHELGGHGVGRNIHEAPRVPNVFSRNERTRLREGMVITLEPFLTLGAIHVTQQNDGWTLRTNDGSLVAQYEHTVVITREKPILVTAV